MTLNRLQKIDSAYRFPTFDNMMCITTKQSKSFLIASLLLTAYQPNLPLAASLDAWQLKLPAAYHVFKNRSSSHCGLPLLAQTWFFDKKMDYVKTDPLY